MSVEPPALALGKNPPAGLWRLLGVRATAADWDMAVAKARSCLAGLPVALGAEDATRTVAAILGEAQFGWRHWQLSRAKRLYYRLRPLLPAQVRPLLQRVTARRYRSGSLLRWPIEDRYVRFQLEAVRYCLQNASCTSAPYVHFWPQAKRFALVLTHDVESAAGQRFVREVADLEERYGFRSSFNFVPERYPIDERLLAELRERSFEVGVHGLRHDGRLFSSLDVFRERAGRINCYLRAWQAVGFRSPMTHRNPTWMQALDVEYDSSFFDTDPFEPIPGGTMSIWPFMMGRFVELPYTLAQDHTLMRTLGESTPRLWLEKVAFVERHCGMALVNTHPDYLRNPRYLSIYEAFLANTRRQAAGYWHALPRDVARWWRRRATAAAEWDGHRWQLPGLPQATIGRIRISTVATAQAGVDVVLEEDGIGDAQRGIAQEHVAAV